MPPEDLPLEPDLEQQKILDHLKGPLLVTGGPGTGKTWALRERFARLIETGTDPERVALVVRSKADRRATRAALFDRLGASLPSLNVLTVHALAHHAVSRRLAGPGHRQPRAVMTAAEQFAFVSGLLAGQDPMHLKTYGGMLGLRGFADEVRNFLLRAQEAMLEPRDIARRARVGGLRGWVELADFYGEYLEAISKQGRVDFAGMVTQAAALAGEGEPLLEHLLVDDYQDATLAIESMIVALAPATLVVAGDPDAHIFSFQGTTDVPIRRFPRVVSGATQLELTEQHRGAAIRHDAWLAAHTSEEDQMVARELRRIHVEERVAWSDLAVVVRRQGTQFDGLLRALDDARIPRHTTDLWTSPTAEPATLPYVIALRWLARPAERDALIEAVLTSDLAGLSPATVRGLLRAARAKSLPPADAIALTDSLEPDEVAALTALREVLAAAEESAGRSTVDAFAALWRGLDLSKRLVAAAEDESAERRELDAVLAFSRMVSKASESGDIPVAMFLDALGTGAEGPGFSADVPGFGAGDRVGEDAVRVLTAHAAAGSEFDTVIVVGAVEGDFPSLTRPEPMFDLALLDGPISQAQRNRLRLEDERRLFRMVLGRARRRVILTASDAHDPKVVATGRSRFAEEMGIEWCPPTEPGAVDASEPLSVDEAAAAWRGRLADLSAGAAERLAALEGLLTLGVNPAQWWFQREWTDTGKPLHTQVSTSFSRLNTLENCPLQFALGEEVGLGQRAGYHAWVGKLVHRLLQDCEEGLIERSTDALIAETLHRWRLQEFPSLAISEEFKRLVTEQMIPNWVREYGDKPAVGLERWFEFEHDGAKIHGYIDRITPITSGGCRITDYKTGRPKDLTTAPQNLQIGIYWLGVTEDESLAAFRPLRGAELAYIKGDSKGVLKKAGHQLSGRDVEPWLDEMRARLSDLIARLRDLYAAGEFRPSVKADCFSCDFKTLCSLYPEGLPLFRARLGDTP